MKLKLKKPMRLDWSSIPGVSGVLLETDIGVGHGKLKAKLMVFDNCRSLHRFWKAIGRGFLGKTCRGAVNGLFQEVISFDKSGREKSWIEADPRYFCMIGLVRGYLSMEIITHESVHAAFNFAKRKSRTPWDTLAIDFDEEMICYPAGMIATAINRVLHAKKLYS